MTDLVRRTLPSTESTEDVAKIALPHWQRVIGERLFSGSQDAIEWPSDAEERSLVDRFEQVVDVVPDRPAVVWEGEPPTTYQALNANSNRIARVLKHLRASTETPVALMLNRGSGFLSSALAVLKAGHFFSVIDPRFPESDARFRLDHLGTGLIVCDSRNRDFATILAGTKREVFNIDDVEHSATLIDAGNIGSQRGGDAIYDIVFTSGSTGTPKAVVRTHRGLLHGKIRDRSGATTNARIALVRSMSGANALGQAWSALLNGAAIYPFDVKSAGIGNLSSWINEHQLTTLTLGSPIFRSLVAAIPEDQLFPSVRVLRLTSQTVLPMDFESYKRHFSNECVFVTGLGGSEQGGSGHSVYFLDHGCQVTTPTVPVGYAFDSEKERYLLDDDGTPVGPDEIGEVVVRSRYLAGGYWNDPERTAATFVPDLIHPDVKTYHTNDMGRMSADGCLEIVGRKDTMVKIRGNRVDLSAIESALVRHPSVKEAVSVAKDDTAGNRRLAAYVVPAKAEGISQQTLRTYLNERLPSFSVPSWIIPLEALPQLPGGKVDRLSLPEPAPIRPELDSAYKRGWTDIEKDLAAIWAEVLGIDRVGVDDDFLELGGDSLMAASMLTKVQKLFKRQIPLATLLRANTIGKMALVLGEEPLAPRTSSLVPIQPKGSLPAFFCVPGVGGHVYELANVARRLGEDQPFYGLEPPGRDGEQKALERIEEMATLFVKEMRSVQPEGPYYIGAYSWGSRVAIEMAHQLMSSGQRIGLLALFDSGFAENDDEKPREYKRALLRSIRQIRRSLSIRTRLKAPFDPAARQKLEDRRSYRKRHRSPVWDANRKASREYRMVPYPGPIAYFRSAEGKPGAKLGSRDGWEQVALGGLEEHLVPGNHYTMLEEPHVAVLASKLAQCLQSLPPNQATAEMA